MTAAHAGCVHLAHFSDVHVIVRGCRWRARDWVSKRLTSWFNLRWLGRGSHFRQVDRVLMALMADLHERGFDHLVFSGDATALGFEEEVALAAALLHVGAASSLPGMAVPGNHDYCTGLAEHSGDFERHFAPWQTGERVDLRATYPFAQRVGPIWLVAVNSAVAKRAPWDASGLVGDAQLRRLETLLAWLGDAPRALVTHYPVWNRRGTGERRFHNLRDLEALLAVARKGGVHLWLHGHNHAPYHHAVSVPVPFPVVCAGSATHEGLWTYGDYHITAERITVQRRRFDPTNGRFADGEKFSLALNALAA
jgi:3',5'-cyclic AMP phosphodiesterase CpdA